MIKNDDLWHLPEQKFASIALGFRFHQGAARCISACVGTATWSESERALKSDKAVLGTRGGVVGEHGMGYRGCTTLPETNIAPENRPLEKEIPIGNHHF